MVNDFPTYGNLFDYCMKAYKTFLICSKSTHAICLTKCRKEAYIDRRQFLKNDHS